MDLPRLTTSTFIGIMVAVTGNVLISFALNLQKLAHKSRKKSLENVNSSKNRASQRNMSNLDENLEEQDEDGEPESPTPQNTPAHAPLPSRPTIDSEAETLIPFPEGSSSPRNYGAASGAPLYSPGHSLPKSTLASRLLPFRSKKPKEVFSTQVLPVEIMSEDAALHGLSTHQKKPPKSNNDDENEDENEGDYLKSKLWWLGFSLMNVGEIGNFISYAYAPASVVAPLGTFALIANCMFAPLLLGERFRKRDLFGIFIAIIGAVTVVLSTNASDTRLDPDALLKAVSQTPFLVYTCIYIVIALILSMLSRGQLGRTWVIVDVGLCAIFGGFTVLSTKALSTLLTMQWIEIFTHWITYPIIAILILTGIGQIRHLNLALMRFTSKVVIPIQFVLFTLSAIIGSAILYGDFKRAKFHQIVTFLYGCAATFAGVFIIAWAPGESEEDEEEDAVGQEHDASVPGSNIPQTPDHARLGMGTLGRRRRATLVLPSGIRDSPVLQLGRQRSAVSLMGISPAQNLLLVHTPPREVHHFRLRDQDGDEDIERGRPSPNVRRRTMSWFGQEDHAERRNNRSQTRDSSTAGRMQNGNGRNLRDHNLERVTSLETHSSSSRR